MRRKFTSILAKRLCRVLGLTILCIASFRHSCIAQSIHVIQGESSAGSSGIPIVGSAVYLYAVGTAGYGASPTSLLVDDGTGRVQIDTSGNGFATSGSDGSVSLAGLYPKCPDPQSSIYAVAVGGDSGAGFNHFIYEVTAIPLPCSALPQISDVFLNEATTVATAFALGSLTGLANNGIAQFGISNQAIQDAFGYANTLVNSLTGNTLATSGLSTQINSLADVISSCVHTDSTGTECQTLMTLSSFGQPMAVTNTWLSALSFAYSPTNNVNSLYSLISGRSLYQPTLANPPQSWEPSGANSPNINGLGSTTSAVGDLLRIFGTGFGSTQSTNAVFIGGAQATIIQSGWSNNEVDVDVPIGATDGYIEIYANGYGSNIFPFVVNHDATTNLAMTLSPTTTSYGSSATINITVTSGTGGTGITPAGSVSCTTTSGAGTPAASLDSNGMATLTINGLPVGQDVITCYYSSSNSLGDSFSSQVETVTSLSSSSQIYIQSVTRQGSNLVVAGSGFGSTQGRGSIQINGSTVSQPIWSDTQITFPLSASVVQGTINVINDGGATANIGFYLPLPQIASLSIDHGPPGIGIVITGSNFGSDPTQAQITIGGLQSSQIISLATPFRLVVQIPNGASYSGGEVVVTTSNGSSVGNPSFIVANPAACSVH